MKISFPALVFLFSATLAQSQYFIVVDISKQDLSIYSSDSSQIIASYPVSTSQYGVGSQAGSNKTPVGKHFIAEKIGTGAKIGTIFKARKKTHQIAHIYTDKTDLKQDFVTTRILRLKGLDLSINLGRGVDSYQRFIYIHGTAEEGLIGSPASHGCVRMKNQDIIEVFNLIQEKDLVYFQK